METAAGKTRSVNVPASPPAVRTGTQKTGRARSKIRNAPFLLSLKGAFALHFHASVMLSHLRKRPEHKSRRLYTDVRPLSG